MSSDEEFSWKQTPEQQEAADDVEPDPDAGMPGHENADDGGPSFDPNAERGREGQAGL